VQTAAATEAQSVRTSAEKWIAGVTALFGLADPPKPLIKVTRADDSEVCGNLLDSTAKSPIRVKKTNGDVVAIASVDLKTVKVAEKCNAG